MTKDEIRRVFDAIGECDKFIAKEGPRIPHLRPQWAAQHLEYCKRHRDKLLAMLCEGIA